MRNTIGVIIAWCIILCALPIIGIYCLTSELYCWNEDKAENARQ